MEPKVLHQFDTRSQHGQTLAHRSHAVLRLGATLGTAEVACAHHGCPALGEPIDSGQRRTDSEIVADFAIVHRHVEVGSHQHPSASDIAEVVKNRDIRHQEFLAAFLALEADFFIALAVYKVRSTRRLL